MKRLFAQGRVGPEDAAGVQARSAEHAYAQRAIAGSPRLAAALDAIGSGTFSLDERGRFAALVDELRYHDHYLLTVDFDVETKLPMPKMMVKKAIGDTLDYLADNLKSRAEQLAAGS